MDSVAILRNLLDDVRAVQGDPFVGYLNIIDGLE
jgi:hypothetical protein